ncbi:hypothetical protein [Streptomyces sp. MMG1121]|nr:hypothetical protein [Streptomyces sp. MMG1121]
MYHFEEEEGPPWDEPRDPSPSGPPPLLAGGDAEEQREPQVVRGVD